MGRHISSRLTNGRQEAASYSVPPNPEQDAGWPIWNDLSGRENQPHQLSRCLCRVVIDPYNCKMVRLLKIERPARLNLGRRIVPSLLVAVTRRRRSLLNRLRAAKRTLEVEVLLCRPDPRAARLARRSRAAGLATRPGGRSRNELPDDRRKGDDKPTEMDMGRIHGSPKPPLELYAGQLPKDKFEHQLSASPADLSGCNSAVGLSSGTAQGDVYPSAGLPAGEHRRR